jgi:hypothetical protein
VIPVILVVLVGAGLAALTYGRLEGLESRRLLPAAFRAVAWIGLGLLIVNPGCPAVGPVATPLVLLDQSLSMSAAGGRWQEARAFAVGAGDVRPFGDPDQVPDSLASAGRSLLEPALRAAGATGRPIVVVSDGEVSDAGAALSTLLQTAEVRLFPRADQPAAGMSSVTGPARIREGDTLVLRVEVVTRGLGARDLPLDVELDGSPIHRAAIRVAGDGRVPAELVVSSGALPAGEHVLSVGLADSVDAERRDDRRLFLVTVAPTPGIVLAAATPDWDTRFLYRTLTEVTALPVEGYVQLEPGSWHRMADLSRVSDAVVRGAISRADLAVLRGSAAWIESRNRGTVLSWPTATAAAAEGDWYVAPGPGGPVPGALAGAPVDSFPPASALVALTPGPGDWVGLTVQAGRRGAVRPALVGSTGAGGRRITVGAQGLWRWAFRGGSSEQAYRAAVAAMVDWLLAAPDTARGNARPLRAVVPRGLALVFQAVSSPEPTPIRFEGANGLAVTDTLRFDGAGRAAVHLPPGVYVYALGSGGSGRVAVEDWSEEWFPRPVVLEQAGATVTPTPRRAGMRDRLWLFGLVIMALSVEWFLRRRMGLR